MALIDLIRKEHIAVPMRASTKAAVLEELVDTLITAGSLSDRDGVLSALRQREALCSTGLENGIAIPHAKTDAVDSLVLALGISPGGIDYEALDGKPSTIFFCILAPPNQAGAHIEALSEIARATKSAAFLRLLLAAENADEVIELFHED